MSQGYSLRVRNMNARAPKTKIGVRLGRLCIAQNIPVTVVAKALGVTRPTVYNWFCGVSAPQGTAIMLVESYISNLENSTK